MAHCLPSSVHQRRSENEQTCELVVRLQENFKEKFNIKAFGTNYDHFCTFKGGGDVQIFVASGSSAAVLHTKSGEANESNLADEDDDDEVAEGVPPLNDPAPNLTPPKRGEYRCGAMENKVTGQQSEVDARL